MLIRALLKKRLFLSRCILLIVLIFANIAFLNGCKPPSATYSTSTDKQPPTTPKNLIAEAISPSKINLDWETSTDNNEVEGYKIFRDGIHIRFPTYGSSTDSGLNPDTKYCYTISAYDGSQNESPQSQPSCATTLLDLTPPSSPTGLIARAVSLDQIDLQWIVSTDDGIVSGYKIFRNGSLIQNITETRFSDTGLNPETQYCYTVSAYDAGGNESDSSNQACAVSSWIITTIDHLSQPPWPAIAIDSSNDAHVVFDNWIYNMGTHRYEISDSIYATNTTQSWIVETIGSQGHRTSLALDSADRVHISFLYVNRLNYATNASGVWLTETIDSTTYVYSHSIAIDSADNVHISFLELASANGALNGDIKYITNASGAWVTETVDSQEDAGYYNSIAVDSAGNVNISYYDSTNGDLKYATNAAGVWVTETVDSQGDVGEYTSIVVDSAGNAHISYYDSTNESLNYTTNASGEWERYILDNWSEFVGEQGSPSGYGFSSIALDSADKVHIVYDWMYDVRYITNR